MNEEKLNRIARVVEAFLENKEKKQLSEKWSLDNVKRVVIIVEEMRGTRIASSAEVILAAKNKPFYPLARVKRSIAEHPVSFKPRGSKTDYVAFGLTKPEAVEIINGLTESNFVEGQESGIGNAPVDVYKKTIGKGTSQQVRLYIKFYISRTDFLTVISFHRDEPKKSKNRK